MLRGMRKASSNWLGKTIMAVVMGVLIVSFGIWGIADIFRGFGRSTLAKVGGTEISTEQFRQIYTDRLQQLGRQFGRPLTPEQARAFGIDRQVLQQTLAEAAMDEEARRMGLHQSDAEVLRTIYNDPTFKGLNGQFDPQRFQAVIRNYGYTEGRYIAEQRRVGLRRQIAGTISAGVEPPKSMVEALTRFRNEQRSIDYISLGAAQAGTIDPPSPEALAAYFDEHKAQFRAPEYRKISFVAVTPEAIGKWETVSDDDAKKIFEQRRDQLSTPEKREISQIVFPNMEEAQAARARITSGTSFDDIAKERKLNLSDVNLGLVPKSAILDPAVGNAAFSLPSGEVSQPVKGEFGVALVKVGKIEPGVTPSYESVAAQIKSQIATERARAKVSELRDKMEDERGGGASVVEAAQKLGLTAVTVDAVDRSGRLPNGQLAPNIPKGLDVVTQAFNSDVGVDNDPIQFEGGYVWYDVLGITPSRERKLDEVREQVEAKWREDQISSRLRAKATDIVQKLDSGSKLADEAAAAGVKVETAADFRRDATPPGVPAAVVTAAFRTAKDGDGQTPTAGGSQWIVFRVTNVTDPPVDFASNAVKQLTEAVRRSMSDEQVAQYVTKIESNIGMSINEAAFAQVTGANN
ncbi:SurA N-terminal domain-containing protein [Bradyrhizobium sp. ISRA443]|uniref:SurA N-terminal domain-containing protein n=1 Tax=unclassified Bradyrhizobium TaxID=2631580 RepID=UPI00247B2003|nr:MULTISPECIES: SurA N-terminal domain-containing protein [unclassified Bradyrhizobium]WGR91998.1 SurA N-terminal domain-containing protein [Bradyrhizobium sp. ISRA435]WGS02420.1 SurA N-terminal domain-containing protein [Bradyrhizobium sp. ISRA436]WGS09305.1 SurA N-terminal domain-containing protein [Bradyrhizobium sp. ISRA437]WGS16194.1 SurA N-terminal domain-containing protein [Bradyrhizobium sp. ISRA443]